jgi:hypothetical protein
MGAVTTAVAMIVLLLFLLVALYFILFKKNKGFQYTDLPYKPCTYDADCRIASGDTTGTAIVERCTKSAGNATGTCSAYCLLNSDCGGGNVGGSTSCQQDAYGRFLCQMAPASGTTCSTAGEVAVTIPAGQFNKFNDTGSYCLILGLNPNAPQAEPRLCQNQSPWGTNLYCTFTDLPKNFQQPCYWTEDCSGGFTCSNGCSLASASSSSGCSGQTPGNCIAPAGQNVGYVSQCSTANPCPSGTCTDGLCVAGSPTAGLNRFNGQLPVIQRQT